MHNDNILINIIKWGDILFIHLVFLFILSLITSIFSIAHSAYSSPVELINICGTTLFLVGLCLYSYYQGRKNNKNYTKSIIGYIILLIVTNIIASITKVYSFAIIFFPNIISMYAITHFMGKFMNNSLVIILSFALELFLIFICYYIGKRRVS